MKGKTRKWLFHGLLKILLTISGPVTVHASSLDYIAPKHQEGKFSHGTFNYVPKSYDEAIMIEPSSSRIGVLHTKLCGVFSPYGPHLDIRSQNIPGAIEDLAIRSHWIGLTPIINEKLAKEIIFDPDYFVKTRTRAYGGKVYCVDVTQGRSFSTSNYANFYQMFYGSDQSPIGIGFFSINDCDVLYPMHKLFAGKWPISWFDALSISNGNQIENSQGNIVLFLIDRVLKRVYVACCSGVPGRFENVFLPGRFASWVEESFGGGSRLTNATCRLRSSWVDFLPRALSGQEKPEKILEKLMCAFVGNAKGVRATGLLAELKEFLHVYETGTLLNREWTQDFIDSPQGTADRLASILGQNVCCLTITSGRFMFPDFFKAFYHFYYDPTKGQFVPEIVHAGSLSDRRVMRTLGNRKILDALRKGQILFFIVDKVSEKVYLVLYRG